ncbi:MAG: hypothetical protein ACYCYP_08225 [Leptospirales bacterium]
MGTLDIQTKEKNKVAIIILADTETHGDMGRVVNALEAAKEFREAKDEWRLIFDGAGTKWIPLLADPKHPLHALYMSVPATGACAFCVDAFEVRDSVTEAGTPLLEEYDRHPSIRRLVSQGFQVITF